MLLLIQTYNLINLLHVMSLVAIFTSSNSHVQRSELQSRGVQLAERMLELENKNN